MLILKCNMKTRNENLKFVICIAVAGISSDLGSSAGVGPGKTWMGDVAGCGGG